MISMPDPQLSIDTVLISVNQQSRMWRDLIIASGNLGPLWIIYHSLQIDLRVYW